MKTCLQRWIEAAGTCFRNAQIPFLLLIVLFLACLPAKSQVTASSSLQGTVFDIKQAVLPGATITVTNKSTGLSRTATSNDTGSFRIDVLPPGIYDVSVAAQGFGTTTIKNVELLIGKTSTLD